MLFKLLELIKINHNNSSNNNNNSNNKNKNIIINLVNNYRVNVQFV